MSNLIIGEVASLCAELATFIGASVVTIANFVLSWAMAFEKGAMLFVISDEIIPESHCKGLEKEGTIGVMAGFVVMMFFDIALG